MIVNINSLTELSGFYVVFNRTIINERDGIYGISHLIEHLISHNFKDDIIEEFQNKGISWNAYTSPTNIVFFMVGMDKFVSQYRNLFLEKVLYIDISEEEFENEKNSLLEEYTSLFNVQSSSHLLNLYRKLFGSYNTIGKKEDIKRITLDECIKHNLKYYVNPSKIINVSKNSEFESNVKFNNFKNDFILGYDYNEDMVYEKYRSIKKSSVIYVSNIITDSWPSVFFINYILSNGVNSVLYKNVRKKSGLAYYIKCNLDRLSDHSGVNVITTETEDIKVPELMDNINDSLKNKFYFLTKEKFENVKSSIINRIDTVNISRYCNVDAFIKPEPWVIEKQIYNLTLDNIIETYEKYFNVDHFYKSVDKREFL